MASTTTPDLTSRTSRADMAGRSPVLSRRLCALGLAFGVPIVLIGCSTGGDQAKVAAAKVPASAVVTAPSSTVVASLGAMVGADGGEASVAAPQVGSVDGGQAQVSTDTTGGGSGSTDGGSGAAQSPTTVAAPAPVITSFTTPDSIDCHNGDFQEFTAAWTTQNTVKVTISIDGPGVYNEYSAIGEASLPFNCSSAHTFTLTAHSSDGRSTTRSVTLQPRNVQADV